MKYFLSFIEEAVLNPAYEGHVGGRVEVHDAAYDSGPYALREIRFFTKDVDAYFKFRDKWDFKTVSGKRLAKIEAEIKEKFYEKA